MKLTKKKEPFSAICCDSLWRPYSSVRSSNLELYSSNITVQTVYQCLDCTESFNVTIIVCVAELICNYV